MEPVLIERNAPQGKGLRAGALGLVSSVVIAVSSTAPAYSMAATLGLIVAIVGVHSPGMLIVSFLPVLCIAYAFRELNKVDPDCGTTFTWTTRAFGPWAGWMGGWGIIAADVIVMASLSQIAGHYALLLAGADRAVPTPVDEHREQERVGQAAQRPGPRAEPGGGQVTRPGQGVAGARLDERHHGEHAQRDQLDGQQRLLQPGGDLDPPVADPGQRADEHHAGHGHPQGR